MKLLKQEKDLDSKESEWTCVLAPYLAGSPRRSQETGDNEGAAPSATKVGRKVVAQTGTSDTLHPPQGGRWLGPSVWLPQVSEPLVTELHFSAAEVRLHGNLLQHPDLPDRGLLLPGVGFWHGDFGDSFQGPALRQKLTRCRGWAWPSYL